MPRNRTGSTAYPAWFRRTVWRWVVSGRHRDGRSSGAAGVQPFGALVYCQLTHAGPRSGLSALIGFIRIMHGGGMRTAAPTGSHGMAARPRAMRRAGAARRALVTLELVTGATGLARIPAVGGGIRGRGRDGHRARLAFAETAAMTWPPGHPCPAASAQPGTRVRAQAAGRCGRGSSGPGMIAWPRPRCPGQIRTMRKSAVARLGTRGGTWQAI